MSKIICPGSYDPVTNGHIDVIRRAQALADKVLVVVANNRQKKYRFTVAQRVAFLNSVFADEPGIEVVEYEGLVADFAKEQRVQIIIKGIRNNQDLSAELAQARINRKISGVETLFLPANPETAEISSTLVKELASFGKYYENLVPPLVAAALAANREEK